jgi:hypothetical protein
MAKRKRAKPRNEDGHRKGVTGKVTASGASRPDDQDAGQRLKILVSSAVYGVEELLEQVYALLYGFGYEVWMSHKGTVPVLPNATAFENCLNAVKQCDLFLGIITTQYGSGTVDGGLGITHQELLKAIEFEKPRWILAQAEVPFLRAVFQKLGCKDGNERAKLLARIGFGSSEELKTLRRRQAAVIDDFRILDMYDSALRHDLSIYQDRKGNWVQKFRLDADANLFVTAQFSRYADVDSFLREQFANKLGIAARIRRKEKRP